nr:immunoglobulin heavy chain junction region [Macaca mulatta]MOW77332.1 immunoglobulin heavy chain junction region [Macaca mulatta]
CAKHTSWYGWFHVW